MKFLPPEDEIRAQLRELTSKTRRLRADLQGMITRRGPSDKAFSHDHRYRLKPRLSAEPAETPTEAEPEKHGTEPDKHQSAPAKRAHRPTPRKRR
jgi:hypothetical protein